MWADSGATWHYGFFGIISQGYISIEYIEDTTVLGIEAQKLEVYKSGIDFMSGQYFESILGYEYTYSDSDRVYHMVGDEFKILYDFSAEIGDTLFHYLIDEFMNPFCDSIGRSIVSEKGIEMINDVELRWYEIEYLDGISAFYSRIYEKIGSMDFLFPTNDICGLDDDYYAPFRCYSDSLFGEYISPEYMGNCEFVYEFPIPDYFANDPKWCITEFYGVGDECIDEYELVHYINGQQTIGSNEYQKLYSRGIHTIYPNGGGSDSECSTGNYYFDNFVAYIRQDGEKILMHSENESVDLVLYDFSLSIGDTISYDDIFNYSIFPEEYGPFVITEIDSIYLYDNFYKRFYFEVPNGPFSEIDTVDYFIEGIGHFQGFIYPFEIFFEGNHYLHAFKKGDIPYYEFTEAYGSCDFAVSVDEIVDDQLKMIISPNPASDKLHIEIAPTTQLKGITIYSLSGQIILTQNPSTSLPAGQEGSGRHTVDISQLQSGMYLLEVESVEGFREVKRFVVE